MNKPKHPLYFIRKQYNLSRADFAFLFKRSPLFIYQIEAGDKLLPKKMHQEICQFFNIDAHELRNEVEKWRTDRATWIIANKINSNKTNTSLKEMMRNE